MKIITLKVHCGCGFVADNLHDGLDHSVETQHQLGVHGSIDIKREAPDEVKEQDIDRASQHSTSTGRE